MSKKDKGKGEEVKTPNEELSDKDLKDVQGGLSLSGSVQSNIGTDFNTAFGGKLEAELGGETFNTADSGGFKGRTIDAAIKGADQLKR